MRITIAQLENRPEVGENLRAIREAIAAAGRARADLVVLPEAAMLAFGAGRLDRVAEDLDGPFATAVGEAAEAAGLVAVAGMFRPADEVLVDGRRLRRVHNTALVTGAGLHVGYDKIRLFDAFGFRESDTVAPGAERLIVDVPVREGERESVRLGLGVCFDIRFPEHFTALAAEGAEVIALPTSWNDGPGKLGQWRTLTAARALDATCALVAVDAARPGGAAAAGTAEGPTGIGHSALIAPDGRRIVEAGYDPQLLTAELDLGELDRVRREIPVLAIRRGD